MPEITEKRTRGRPRHAAIPDKGSVQTLDRAILLLKHVSDRNGMSLTEISRFAELHPSTAYRMLTTLQQHGLLEFEDQTQLWFVGVETFRMGAAFLRRRKLAERGHAFIQKLMLETGETANLALAEADGVVFVSQVETHEAIRAFFRPGTRSTYHASGIGKAILAHLSPKSQEAILRQLDLTSFTPSTITSRPLLQYELSKIKKQGFALDDEERNQGMRCIAVPVFNEFGDPIGGVSISGPTIRFPDHKISALAECVKASGSAITTAMGGFAPLAQI